LDLLGSEYLLSVGRDVYTGERRGSTEPANARYGSAAPAGRGHPTGRVADVRRGGDGVFTAWDDDAAAVCHTGRTDSVRALDRCQTAGHQFTIHYHHSSRRSANRLRSRSL